MRQSLAISLDVERAQSRLRLLQPLEQLGRHHTPRMYLACVTLENLNLTLRIRSLAVDNCELFVVPGSDAPVLNVGLIFSRLHKLEQQTLRFVFLSAPPELLDVF